MFFCVVLESPLFVPYNEAARRAIIVHAWSLYFTVSPTNTQRTEHGMRSNERPKVQRSLGTRRTLGYFFFLRRRQNYRFLCASIFCVARTHLKTHLIRANHYSSSVWRTEHQSSDKFGRPNRLPGPWRVARS